MKTNRFAPKKDSKDVPATATTGRPSQRQDLQRTGSSHASISGIQRQSFLDLSTPPSEPTRTRSSSSAAARASVSRPISAIGDPRPRKLYPCDHCSKVFTTRQNLLSHHRIRQGVYPFKCDSCNMVFVEYSTLYKHKKIHAKVREKFKCSVCKMTYLSKLGLKKHQKKFHPIASEAKCQQETTLSEDKNELAPIAKDEHEPAEKMGEKQCSQTVVQESQLVNEIVCDNNIPGAADVISATSDTDVISDVAVATSSVTATPDIVIPASEVPMVTSDPEVPSTSRENVWETLDPEVPSTSRENVWETSKGKQTKYSPRRSDHVLSETIQFETTLKQNRTDNEKDGDKTTTGATATSEHSSDISDKPVERSKEHSGGKGKVTRAALAETKSRTANKENAQTPLRDHGWRRRYNCKFCPESFPQAVLLKTHVETTHLDSKRYCCWECDQVFANPKALDAHAEKHAARKFECKTCKKSFAQKITLVGHIRCHTREQPFQCDVCDRKFAHYQSRDAHKRFHTREKAYRCQSCDFKTSWRSSMSTHLLLHKGERPHKCKQCAMRFTQKSQLKRHMKGVHNPEKKCKVCGDYVKNRKAMVAHLAEHNGDSPFQCEYCDEGFVKMFQLKKHVLESHTLPNRCDECGAAFAYPSGLKVHKLTHTQIRDFRCDFENCGASFSRVSNLNAHRRLHTGDLPHACDLCDRKYDRRALLVVHVRNFHEAKRNRSAPRKSRYRESAPRPRTRPETGADPTTERATEVATVTITHVETESQSEDTIIVSIPATKTNKISTRVESGAETTQHIIVTPPRANSVSTQQSSRQELTDSEELPESTASESEVDVPVSETRQSQSEASFELSLEHQSPYMEVNAVTTPPQTLTPLRNPDMESDAGSFTGSDRQPVPTASPHSPFTERLRQYLSPPKTLAPVEIWTASDDSCFTVRRLPQPDGPHGLEDQEDHNIASRLVDIGAGEHNLVALSQVNETSLQKYRATSLTKRKDGGSTSSGSTVGVTRGQKKQIEHRTVLKTGAKRKMGPLSFVGGPAKQRRVVKSPHKTGEPKRKISITSKTLKDQGKRKTSTITCSPKSDKGKTKKARSRKIAPLSSGTKSSQSSSRKSAASAEKKQKPSKLTATSLTTAKASKTARKKGVDANNKTPRKKKDTPVKAKSVTKTPRPKTPVKAKSVTKSPSPKTSVKAKSVTKSPSPKTSIKAKSLTKSPSPKTSVKAKSVTKTSSPKTSVKAKSVTKTSSPQTPVKARSVSKTPEKPVNAKSVSKTKSNLAAKRRKVSRRPTADTPKKRGQLPKKAVPGKPAAVAARRSKPTGDVKRIISDHSDRAKKPTLKRARIVRATVTVQDLPIIGKGKSRQPLPRRKVSNFK